MRASSECHPSLWPLTITAASIGVGHTLARSRPLSALCGPRPARGWSRTTTVLVTVAVRPRSRRRLVGRRSHGRDRPRRRRCEGRGDRVRPAGDIAAWLLTAFGLVYMVWGIRARRGHRTHSHFPRPRRRRASTPTCMTTSGLTSTPMTTEPRRRPSPPGCCSRSSCSARASPLIPILMYPAAADSGVWRRAGSQRVQRRDHL